MNNQEEVFVNLYDNHGGDPSARNDKGTPPSSKLEVEIDHQMISELARRTVAGMLVAISSGAELARRVRTYIDERQRDGR